MLMNAVIIKPEFGKTAQSRDDGFAADLKNMSSLVAEMSLYHSEIRAKGDWRSKNGKPHRFLIFSYTDKYGLDPTARSSVETANEYISDIAENSDEIFLAVTRLDKPFEAQWPREKSAYTLSDLQKKPIDLRFQEEDSVVTRLEFGSS